MPSLDELLREISDDLREQGAINRADMLSVARANIREVPARRVNDVFDALAELEILRDAVQDAVLAVRLQAMAPTPSTGAVMVRGSNHWKFEGGESSG